MSTQNLDILLRTIALADDDGDDVELFGEALVELNAEIVVEAASNGQELLQNLKNRDANLPDIIFLDINMPEMNGWDCLIELKKNEELKHIPVIIYSTSSNINDKYKASKLGASYFYTKPDSFQELKSFLSRLINDPESVLNIQE